MATVLLVVDRVDGSIVFGDFFVFLALGFRPRGPVAGEAEGIGIFLVLGTCFLIAWLCTLLGTIAGWVGVRRSGSLVALAWASLAVNTVLCLVGVPVAARFILQWPN
jgi:hypothetical protein